MKKISPEKVKQAYTYEAYRQLIDDLMLKKQTTGDDHSEAMLHYTNMNIVRMERLDKKIELDALTLTALENIKEVQIWLVLTEAWCGDAAQTIPVMHKMAESNSNITLGLLLRDQHLDLMDEFLTNGARSIPKLLVLNEQLEVRTQWGPRPKEVQQLLVTSKKYTEDMSMEEKESAFEQLKIDVQKWYNKDKGMKTQQEILASLEQA